MDEKIENAEDITVTLKAMSAILNLSDRRIRQLVDEGIVVKKSRGQYLLLVSVQNYIRFIKTNSAAEKVKSDVEYDLDKERAKHEAVKREKTELSLAVMKGELHEAKDVERVMTDILMNFKAKILAIPSKLAPALVSREDVFQIQSMLDKEMRLALHELAEYNATDFYSDKVVEIDQDAIEYLEGEDNSE